MDIMMLLKAALLAVICGVAEFLPISSNGHVLIMDTVLGFEGPPGKLFEISLQLGSILAICWLYRAKLLHTACCIATDKKDQRFALNIFLAFIPAGLLGYLFHHQIIEYLFNAWVVAIMLIVGGFAILAVEKWKPAAQIATLDDITPMRALSIGLFQMIALIPGVSRSAATILGAMLLKIERKTAAEFSFFLAIPMIVVASFFDLFIHRHEMTMNGLSVIAIGFVIAFFSAMLVVQWLMNFISRHGFVPFAYYRIIAGTLVLLMLARFQ
jgi:undecaprenyl-diphosphatase